MTELDALRRLAERLEHLFEKESGGWKVRVAWAEATTPESESALRRDLEAWFGAPMSLPRHPRPEQVAARRALLEAGRLGACTPVRASLSHSAEAAIAVAGHAARPVGIDLERRDRLISNAVRARIRNVGDAAPGVPPIGIWAVKEALYKAGAAPAFRSIEVRLGHVDCETWTGESQANDRRFRLACAVEGDWLAALALGELKAPIG